MIITKAMWKKTLDEYKQNLDRVQKRNDIDDKYYIEQYAKTIQEIEQIILNK